MAGNAADGGNAASVSQIIQSLNAQCNDVVGASHNNKFDQLNGGSYALASDLDVWNKVLTGRQECALYSTASSEYIHAFLNNSQGQYRNAFKGLRLVLELILQGVYLSANIVTLNEWLNSQADTIWNTILDKDRGVLCIRFCRAFFPELENDVAAFKTLSETLYREMSECTHGNVPNAIPLPNKIIFDEATFTLWHKKASTLRYIVNFTLTMRYVLKLKTDKQKLLAPVISDNLNHIEPIRRLFAGLG